MVCLATQVTQPAAALLADRANLIQAISDGKSMSDSPSGLVDYGNAMTCRDIGPLRWAGIIAARPIEAFPKCCPASCHSAQRALRCRGTLLRILF